LEEGWLEHGLCVEELMDGCEQMEDVGRCEKML
jgi:hypothetical protein